MTDKTPTSPPTSRGRKTPVRSPLYRSVLSIAVASIVAAWLPFSVLYISALSKRAQTVANVKAVPQPASPASAQPAAQLAPVTTRTS